MPAQQVEAIWCFPPSASNYRALYGRINSGSDRSLYTKDYLQVGGEAGRTLAQFYGVHGPKDVAEVTYCWPGDSAPGAVTFSSDRRHLKWDYSKPPAPLGFTVAPGDPSRTETLPGRRGAALLASQGENSHDENSEELEQDLAEQQWEALRAEGFNPWLVFVRLFDDPERLHVRLYLDDPPTGYEFADLSMLPSKIIDAIRASMPSQGYAAKRPGPALAMQFDRSGEALLESQLARRIWSVLQNNRNVLLSGPPGTGKTVALDELTRFFVQKPQSVLFDPEKLRDAWSEHDEDVYESRTRSVVFHPSYGYEDFVLGVLPEPTPHGVGVKVRPGPLLCLGHYASQPQHRAMLTLDEFNRGNAAAIFGDTLALLDTDKRQRHQVPGSGAFIDRAYPGMQVTVPTDLVPAGRSAILGDTVSLPDELYVIAAMNSSDRSVSPLDAAMRRRFSILFISPDYDVLAEHLGAAEKDEDVTTGELSPAWEKDFDEWEARDVAALAVDVLRAINHRISFVSGSDFLLGQAQLWQVSGDDRDEALMSLSQAFDRNIMGTLRMTYLDYDQELAGVLGVDSDASSIRQLAHWQQPPAGLEDLAEPRLLIQAVSELSAVEQAAVLTSLAR